MTSIDAVVRACRVVLGLGNHVIAFRNQMLHALALLPAGRHPRLLDPGDRPMLTLVTCYPFAFIGHAPHRYVIQAVLVERLARTPSNQE